MSNKTIVIVTVNELGAMNKKGARDTAKYLRKVADTVENDYKLWTKKKAVFRLFCK